MFFWFENMTNSMTNRLIILQILAASQQKKTAPEKMLSYSCENDENLFFFD